MDPVTIGAAAAAIFATRMLDKAAETAGDQIGEAAGGRAAGLVAWVRGRLGGRPELARVEDAPDSPSRVEVLGEVLDAELVDDPQAGRELASLVEAVKSAHPQVWQQAIGDYNVQVGNNSTVTINRHGPS